MASRSNAGPTAPIYEDFQPKSEQKEEQEAHVLYIHLPDFSKEYIRVSYIDATRTIRVQGERPLGRNKLSRFNRTFAVPENCFVDKISGRFQEGVLAITIPKQTIAPPRPTTAPKQEETKITPKELAPPPKEPSLVTAPPPKVPSPVAAPPPKEPSPAEAPPPKVPPSVVAPPLRPPEEPSLVAAPPLPPIKEPSLVVAPPPSPKVPSSVVVPPKRVAPVQLPQGETIGKDKESSPAFQAPQKPIIESKAQKGQVEEDTSAKATPKQRTEKKDSKAPYESKSQKQHETATEIVARKDPEKKGDVDGERAKVKEETSFGEKAKKLKNVAVAMMKTAWQKKEDQHLIVNVGVTVLVIVAVGAYVTYKIRSSAKAKD